MRQDMKTLEHFHCLSLNYKSLSLEQREAFVQHKYHKAIIKLCEEGHIVGYVPLITCLRIEFYFHIENPAQLERIEEILAPYKGAYEVCHGLEAVEYLYRVACGFESVIQGEDEILSQLKIAFAKALEGGWSSKLLNVLMNKAIALGKKIRTVSKISHNTRSLQATVIKMLRQHYGNSFSGKKVLLIGMGDLAQDIMKLLIGQVEKIIICNRTASKMQGILEQYDVVGVDYHAKYDYIDECDIVICATAAPHPILYTSDVKEVLVSDKERVIVDLAVPRDVEEGVSHLTGVHLLNLDDCWKVYQRSKEEREDYATRYGFLLDEQIRKTLEWMEYGYKQA